MTRLPREKNRGIERERERIVVRNDDPPGWKRRDERFREPRRAKFRNTTIAIRNSPRSPFSPKWMSPWLVFMAGWLCLMYYSSGFRTGFHFVDLKYHSFSKKKKRASFKRSKKLVLGTNLWKRYRWRSERERERLKRLEWIVLGLVNKFKLSCFNPTVNLAVSNSKIKQLH